MKRPRRAAAGRHVLGMDVGGVVEAVGPGVQRFKAGGGAARLAGDFREAVADVVDTGTDLVGTYDRGGFVLSASQ